jgi:hypothetical protein
MSDESLRRGARAVLEASSVTLATVVFLPGVLVRIGCQALTSAISGMRIAHHKFVTDLGGEVEHVSGPRAWSKLLIGTMAGPMLIGAVLLMPTIVRTALLDVRPFASVASDPGLVLGRDTSLVPFFETLDRFGWADSLRLWFGISCFYCCIPSSMILSKSAEENSSRGRWSPRRMAFGPLIGLVRALRALDNLLTFGFAGTYLASGLVVLLVSWRLLTYLAHLLI